MAYAIKNSKKECMKVSLYLFAIILFLSLVTATPQFLNITDNSGNLIVVRQSIYNVFHYMRFSAEILNANGTAIIIANGKNFTADYYNGTHYEKTIEVGQVVYDPLYQENFEYYWYATNGTSSNTSPTYIFTLREFNEMYYLLRDSGGGIGIFFQKIGGTLGLFIIILIIILIIGIIMGTISAVITKVLVYFHKI